MKRGDIVRVRLWGGSTALRRVVAVKPKVVVICSEWEFQAAMEEKREPQGLGFPHADVMPIEQERSNAD